MNPLISQAISAAGKYLAKEIQNVKFNVGQHQNGKLHLGVAYKHDYLCNIKKDFVLDYESVISKIRDMVPGFGKTTPTPLPALER